MQEAQSMHPEDPNRCPQCGGVVFHAVPGKTTMAEVVAFKEEMARRRGWVNDEPDWIHPGAYCHDCEWGYLAHYPLPEPIGPHDARDVVLVFESAGRNTTGVAAVLKDLLRTNSREALARAKAGPGALVRRPSGDRREMQEWVEAIERAGGVARLDRAEWV